jgi:hypothetical protein
MRVMIETRYLDYLEAKYTCGRPAYIGQLVSRAKNCVIAQAINRVLAPGYHSIVGNTKFDIKQDGYYTQPVENHELPRDVQESIAAFDQEGTYKPVCFFIELPEECAK